ncbi:MAG: RNA polymerase sigma factor [Firmicutes bacterium]|nr:RNA polymerase sigma factor [Bacillota bacterium]
MKKPMTEERITQIYERHKLTVYRVCFTYMKNASDTEDAVSDTFIQMIKANPDFQSEEHEKAWLIRTASNICKNVLRSWWRKRTSLDEVQETEAPPAPTNDVLTAVRDLPDKLKNVVYMYYYEGYSSVEIAKALFRPQSTIRNYLHDARKILKEKLGGDFNEE